MIDWRDVVYKYNKQNKTHFHSPREFLTYLYVAKGMGIKKIEAHIGVSRTAIRNRLSLLGIEMNKGGVVLNRSRIAIFQIPPERLATMTTSEIAAETGCTVKWIFKVVKANNLKIRKVDHKKFVKGSWKEKLSKTRRICTVCGKEYTPTWFSQKRCSDECKKEGNRLLTEKWHKKERKLFKKPRITATRKKIYECRYCHEPIRDPYRRFHCNDTCMRLHKDRSESLSSYKYAETETSREILGWISAFG